MSSSTFKPEPRPFRLEVWEMDPDLADEAWRVWSTYRTEANARERADKLTGQGKQARVTVTDCEHCGSDHGEPFDGSCLL